MSLVPAFEIGVWNAWILWILMFLSMIVPNFFMSKEAKERAKRATRFTPLSGIKKVLAYSTHAIIMPAAIIYSIFLPLKIGAVWLYIGLPIFTLSLVMTIMINVSFATGSVDKPVTRGFYRISRHPIYLSAALMYIGIGIACASWVLMLCSVLWIVIFGIVIPSEERFLIDQYGDTYREYMNRTPRWIGLPKSGEK
jgi:protein-S-isoprenylcysteine O-methyltransferase Ste14